MKKWAVITGILVLLAAGAITWWYAARRAELALMPYWTGEYPDWAPKGIEEPPISEQIEAQIASIETGDDVPLPIPLYIAGERIHSLEFDWLRDKLKSLGYSERAAKDDEFESDGYMYAHPEYREVLRLSYMSFDSTSGSTSLFVFPKSFRGFSYDPNFATLSNTAGEKVGFFLGRLHMGIPLTEAEKELSSVPHRDFDSNVLDSQLDFRNMEASDWINLFKRRIRGQTSFKDLMRGKHSYLLTFNNGEMDLVFVMSSDNVLPERAQDYSEEKIRRFVGFMFARD